MFLARREDQLDATVLTTCPATEAAAALAEQIVEALLAACVQVLPQMTAIYIWEGAIKKENECLLLVKTPLEKRDELSEFIIANHSYEIPEIIALDSEKISEPYRRWLGNVLS